ncbi:MAG: protein kinase [Acidobacteriota bacterium]
MTGDPSLEEVIRRAAAATGDERRALVDRHLSRLPLVRSTVLDLLAERDEPWLRTGGALRNGSLRDLGSPVLGPGDRLGSIRIEAEIGEGGMGTVHLGVDESLDRAVAVKTLRADLAPRPEAIRRFEREAKILSRLDHPAICQIHGLEEHDGIQHLILERVEGETLRRALPRLDHDTRLGVIQTVADALRVAHAEGVVHRDLKPDNVMITPAGQVKVLDFGVARVITPRNGNSNLRAPAPPPAGGGGDRAAEGAAEEDAATADPLSTRLGALLGTVAYMSPEQARGEPVGPSSDLFSLGLILHELSSATPPHPPGLSRPEVLARLAEGRLDPPTGVGGELGRLLDRLCHVDSRRRGDAASLGRDLASIRDAPARLRQRKRRRRLGAAVALILAAAAGVALEARWSAQRQAAGLERFARQSSEIIWRWRTAELAPRHDVAPGRALLFRDLERLESELGSLSGPPAAAGHRSIGRAWLALGAPEQARIHLEAADDLRPEDAETAWWLGRVYSELYRRALDATAALERDGPRQRAREQARFIWRRRALDALERARSAPDADPQWLEALIASHEERFDDARRALEGVDAEPWAFEAALLAGDIERQRAHLQARGPGELTAFEGGLLAAQRHYRRAMDFGRSSAAAHGRGCATAAERIRVAALKRTRPVAPEELDAMWILCDSASEIDEGAPRVRLAVAQAHRAEGRWLADRGAEALPSFERAIAHLGEKPADEHEPTDRLLLRGAAGSALAYVMARSDPANDRVDGVIERAMADLAAVWRARADDPSAAELIGNTRMVQAFRAISLNRDPLPAVEAALPFLEGSLERHPDIADLHTMLGHLQLVAGRHLFNSGQPAVATLEAAVASYRRAVPEGGANEVLARGDLGLAQARDFLDPRPTYRQAIKIADRRLAADPGAATLWGYRGLVRFYLGCYLVRRGEDPTRELVGAVEDHRKEIELGSGSADTRLAAAVMPLWLTRWRLYGGQPQDAELRTVERAIDAWRGQYGEHADLANHRVDLGIQRGLSAWVGGKDPRPDWRATWRLLDAGASDLTQAARQVDMTLELGVLEIRHALEQGEDVGPLFRKLDQRLGSLDGGPTTPETPGVLHAVLLALRGEMDAARQQFATLRSLDPTATSQLRLMAPELVPPLLGDP